MPIFSPTTCTTSAYRFGVQTTCRRLARMQRPPHARKATALHQHMPRPLLAASRVPRPSAGAATVYKPVEQHNLPFALENHTGKERNSLTIQASRAARLPCPASTERRRVRPCCFLPGRCTSTCSVYLCGKFALPIWSQSRSSPARLHIRKLRCELSCSDCCLPQAY